MSTNILQLFSKITTLIFDVDGVLTDCTVLVLDNGLQARRMHIKDGFGLQMAVKNGFRVVIISGGHSDPVIDRLIKLGIPEVYMSVMDKKEFLTNYLAEKGLQWDEILYMGDDLPDLSSLKAAGVSCAPADAVPELLEIADYVATLDGGKGCVREVIEKVLKVQGKWNYDGSVTSR
jgi:3-deoxy-D-manno-octulosonate 8-phosphate phosphatase (KDO 8-P phosphatase)